MIGFVFKAFFSMLLIAIVLCSKQLKEILREETFKEKSLVFLHLLSVGTLLGMQAWVTFVSGVTMFKSVPRHVFGHLQSKLWPKFFMIGTSLSFVAIVTNGAVWRYKENRTLFEEIEDTSGLILGFVCGLANSFILEPQGAAVWRRRIEYEQSKGFGDEIGAIKDTTPLKSVKYDELTHKFALLHGLSSITSMCTYIGGLVYLWFLACNLASFIGVNAHAHSFEWKQRLH